MSDEFQELREDYEDLRREVQRMQLYIDECWQADEILHPSNPIPTPKQEEYWNERGWEADGFGSWAPPGYHIVRPGKIQKNDY